MCKIVRELEEIILIVHNILNVRVKNLYKTRPGITIIAAGNYIISMHL